MKKLALVLLAALVLSFALTSGSSPCPGARQYFECRQEAFEALDGCMLRCNEISNPDSCQTTCFHWYNIDIGICEDLGQCYE